MGARVVTIEKGMFYASTINTFADFCLFPEST